IPAAVILFWGWRRAKPAEARYRESVRPDNVRDPVASRTHRVRLRLLRRSRGVVRSCSSAVGIMVPHDPTTRIRAAAAAAAAAALWDFAIGDAAGRARCDTAAWDAAGQSASPRVVRAELEMVHPVGDHPATHRVLRRD